MQKRKRTQSQPQKRFKKKQRREIMDLYKTPMIQNWKLQDTSNTAKEFALDSSTAATSYVSSIGAGDGINARDGLRVLFKSLSFRGQIYSQPPLAGNYPNDTISLAIVYDKQPNGALPTWGNVFQGIDGRVDALAPINYASNQRFMVLRRWTIATNNFVVANGPIYTSLDAMNIVAQQGVLEFHTNINLKLGAVWSSGSGAIAALVTGGFFLMTQANTAIPASSPWFLDYTLRVKYTDNIKGV